MPKKSKKSSSFFYIYLDSYDCNSCKEIRYLLSEYPYEEILMNNENSDYIFNKIDKYTYSNRELPMIFIDDVYIGKIQDLKLLLKLYNNK